MGKTTQGRYSDSTEGKNPAQETSYVCMLHQCKEGCRKRACDTGIWLQLPEIWLYGKRSPIVLMRPAFPTFR